MHPQQQSFENLIDKDPHNATSHLAYADWLDESGHDPHEAKFRRSMGEWLQKNPKIGSYFAEAGPPEEPDNPQTWPWHLEANGWSNLDVPSGVGRFPFSHENDYENGQAVDSSQPHGYWEVPRQSHHPVWVRYIDPDDETPIAGRFAWPNYRAMEKSFRESFMRNQVDPERVSRIARAYKMSRRGA